MRAKLIFILTITMLLFAICSQGQDDAWRKGEMEVEVKIKGAKELEVIGDHKLNGDIGLRKARLYLTPGELNFLKEANIPYRILVDDLNAHYQNFWESKDAYHTYQEIIDIMDSLDLQYPLICEKLILGTSVQGREISVLKISDNVQQKESEGSILLDGGIHGDEIGAAENLIRFAMELCDNYGTDPYITELIDTREIWILPMINPDGRENMSRYNANGIDLNRDFGYMWDGWGSSPEPYSQMETKVFRDFILDKRFSLQVSYHSGLEIFIYPWYYRTDPAPDVDEADAIAQLYSASSGYASLPYSSGGSLYGTNGSSAEASYGIMGLLGTAMEISDDKQPHDSLIMLYYNWNVQPSLYMIEQAGYGVAGHVTDSVTGEPLEAIILVEDKMPVYTNPATAYYQKYLLQGEYNIKVIADGYQDKVISNISIQDSSLLTLNIELLPEQFRNYAYRVISCQIPGNNFNDEGNTAAVIGAPDNVNYSIGLDGWVIVDMNEFILDKLGNDIIVYEGDYLSEYFSAFASTTIDGPWEFLGNGTGTHLFDMSTAGLDSLRYVKIVDDGVGTSGNNAGYDLDAVSDVETPAGISIDILSYEIDDSNGNASGTIDPGETVYIRITLGNLGMQTANNVEGELSCQSVFVTIDDDTSSFGMLAFNQVSTGIFTLTASPASPIAEEITLVLAVAAENGAYNKVFYIDLLIGRHPVMIIDLDGNTNSGSEMKTSIESLGIDPVYYYDFPENPEAAEIIFLCLGTPPENHILSTSEGIQMAAFLDNGGRLYMEGADTWFDDPPTAVHPYFSIEGMVSGNGDLGIIMGMSGTFTEGMSFAYDGDNNSIDRLSTLNNSFSILRNQIPAYPNSIAYESSNYKTIGSSFEFGGLVDGNSSKVEFMEQVLIFFGGLPLGIPEGQIQENILVNCYPNPSFGEVLIEIYTSKKDNISIDIFTLAGQKLKSIRKINNNEGLITIRWQGDDQNGNILPSGLYLVKVSTNNALITKKIILNR